MLDMGIYLACSAYETGFISTTTTDDMIDETIEACRKSLIGGYQKSRVKASYLLYTF